MKTLLLTLLLTQCAFGQWMWAVDKQPPQPAAAQPTLAPHDCYCGQSCKCDPCECNVTYAAPVQSVKKHDYKAASVQVTDVVGRENYHGSGTVVDWKDGVATVITCEHVVNHGGKVFVGWIDGTVLPATVVRVNARDDVALLTVKCDKVPTVPIAKQPPKVGEQVFTYGFVNTERTGRPIHRGGGNESRITHLGRYERRPGQPFSNQGILGPQPQGRSGGGLFNSAGELVGVCSCDDPPRGRKNLHEGIFAGHDAVTAILKPQSSVIMNCSNGQCFPQIAPKAITPKSSTPEWIQDPNCTTGQCPLIPRQAPSKLYPAAR